MGEPVWTWPTDDPERLVTSDSADHARRGTGPALDIPSWPVRGVPAPARILKHRGAQGRVTRAIDNPDLSPCGRQLDVWWIADGARWECRSCHWDRLDVATGDLVYDWTVCGVMGTSGEADGVHQHTVLWRNGVRVTPEEYVFEGWEPPAAQPEPVEVPVEPTIEERMEAVEQELQRLRAFGLGTLGNVTLEDGGREPSNPVKLLLGKLGENLGLYGFFQRRFAGQAQGEYWAGLETSVPADPPANGYGGLPMRLWGQNVLLESNGALVVRTAVAERIYLSPPVYRDLRTGAFVSPSAWSDAGEPLDADGNLLGGIMYDTDDLGTYLTVHEGRPVLVHQGEIRELAR